MLENRIFDGLEYTLVDSYDWKDNEHIYHFAGDESDLFCQKKDNNYLIIRNEKTIDDILEYYLLKNPEIYFMLGIKPQALRLMGIKNIQTISDEKREKIEKETIDKLTQLKVGIDKDVLLRRLNDVNICTGNWDNLIMGFFHPATNTVFFPETDNFEDKESERTRLHEMIHAISGAGYCLFSNLLNRRGFIEGATENIVEKLHGNKTSSVKIYLGSGSIRYNFSKAAAYDEQVSLIRQMEYAMGTDCDSSILMGNLKFFNNFAQKYGKDTLRFLRHRSNRLLHPEKIKNYVQYFKETQNTLLEIIFNKDLEGIQSLEDAQSYFKRLQGFELVRGDVEGDITFKEFYETKLQIVKDRLIEKGFSEENIQKVLEQCLYRKSEFLPRETEEERDKRIHNIIMKQIAKEISGCEDREAAVSELRGFVAKKEAGEDMILTRSGKPIFMRNESRNENGSSTATIFDFIKKIPEGYDFYQEDDSFYISAPDGSKILLEEIELTQYVQQPQEKTQVAQEPKVEKEEGKETTITQLNAIKKIANTQLLSNVNEMINQLRERIKSPKDKTKEGVDYGRE